MTAPWKLEQGGRAAFGRLSHIVKAGCAQSNVKIGHQLMHRLFGSIFQLFPFGEKIIRTVIFEDVGYLFYKTNIAVLIDTMHVINFRC